MDIAVVAVGENPLPSFVVLEQSEEEQDEGARGNARKVAEDKDGRSGNGKGAEAAENLNASGNREEEPFGKPREARAPAVLDRRGRRRLPIRIGSTEAAAISSGVNAEKGRRPKTHDLLAATVKALGAELLCVRITKVSGATFYAQLVLRAQDGSEACVDARPSDAIALAVRLGVSVLASEDVLEAASMLDFTEVEQAVKASRLADFHDFVENVVPEDFRRAE